MHLRKHIQDNGISAWFFWKLIINGTTQIPNSHCSYHRTCRMLHLPVSMQLVVEGTANGAWATNLGCLLELDEYLMCTCCGAWFWSSITSPDKVCHYNYNVILFSRATNEVRCQWYNLQVSWKNEEIIYVIF